jgi:protein-L-isoaspartate(D-aspartate) O-methyltransferase
LGWMIPPPSAPTKDARTLRAERKRKVAELSRCGLLRSERIRLAMLAVPREEFVPRSYRDHAYEEIPLPLPGARATISCPHSYPLFYEPLGLDRGHHFLEVGTGSGYGAAVAREVVGDGGVVVSVELDPETLEYARGNLRRTGYDDVVLVRGDGTRGHPERAPYDRIAVTAAVRDVPHALVEQLVVGGRLIGPVWEGGEQVLRLLTKESGGVRIERLGTVLYVDMCVDQPSR